MAENIPLQYGANHIAFFIIGAHGVIYHNAHGYFSYGEGSGC